MWGLLEDKLQYWFKDKNLLKRSLSHKSFVNEQKQNLNEEKNNKEILLINEGNERLEFLGDAVIDLITSQILMERFPFDSEGQLSKKRASLVNENRLFEMAEEIGLSDYICLGKGEIQNGGEKNPRLLSSTLEAIMGAIFLESGYEAAQICWAHLMAGKIENFNDGKDFFADFKTRLQEIVQSENKPFPIYKVISESGPSHDRLFEVEVYIENYSPTRGTGKSKKIAEQEAARQALEFWSKPIGEL